MKVLASFPGKFGDLLWAMPSVRALSRRIGVPVHLLIAGQYGGLKPLLLQQPYIADVEAADWWQVQNTAPMTPRTPPDGWQDWINFTPDAWCHLAYRDWPKRPLPYETLDCLNSQWLAMEPLTDADLRLTEPWIQVGPTGATNRCDLAIAFTDEHFELKFGLSILVVEQLGKSVPTLTHTVLCPAGSRWATETRPYPAISIVDWLGYANVVANAKLVLADCSAAHVLAVAMGKPVVCVEPNPMRHNAIFWPLGTDGQVLLVLGNDGLPTCHAPHVTDALKAFYESAKAVQQ